MEITQASAVVTGAASGLGAATASALAAQGARVVGIDLDTSRAAQVDGVTYLTGDVTDEKDVRRAVEVAAELGPLRVAVNCAGIGPSARILGRQGPHDLALFSKVVQVNLVGTFTLMTLAAESMAQNEPQDHGQRGVVVNTASIAAFDGQIGQAAYSASKGGVVALTLSAARDLAQHGIRVVTIAPGAVETPMLASVSDEFRAGLAAGVPFPQRLGRPDEFGRLVTMIVEHDYLNGETIRMDGALRMTPR